GRGLLAVRELAEHALDLVDRAQHEIDIVGIERPRVRPREIQQVLRAMTDVDERLEAEKSRSALDRVERAEYAVQHVSIVRRRFEPEQVRVERLDELARLGKKIVEQLVVHNSSQARGRSPARRGRPPLHSELRKKLVDVSLTRDDIRVPAGQGRTFAGIRA